MSSSPSRECALVSSKFLATLTRANSNQKYIEHRGGVDLFSSERFQELSKVWSRVIQLEVEFWDMAMRDESPQALKYPNELGIPLAKL